MSLVAAAKPLPRSCAQCRHCGGKLNSEGEFCCRGCAMAYELVNSLGLGLYYGRRQIDQSQRLIKPEDVDEVTDLSAWVRREVNGISALTLLVDGLHCGACIWLIEQTLQKQQGVLSARVSLATRRLTLRWETERTRAETLVPLVQRLGYRLVPCDTKILQESEDAESKHLLRCLAVAGFAAGNIMLLSTSIWSGEFTAITAGTRDLFHWISALIALPAIAYAGRPFFASALNALRARRTNMDVPISLAVILAPSVSLYETFSSGAHAYFDSATTLLFFLLIGRYLDHRVRRAARAGVERLLALNAISATVLLSDGTRRELPPRHLRPGMKVLVQPGAKIPADGNIVDGSSELDISLLSGESAPCVRKTGDEVFAGTVNLTGVLTIEVRKTGEDTQLAEIIRLTEAAETRRGRYVRIADRVARYYSPVVHVTALATFLAWTLFGGMAWQSALMISVAVLIITCPCALALAVPVVQVAASQRLMRAGVLLKSGDALERLGEINHIVLDKTGTLTTGRPSLASEIDPAILKIAAGIAINSHHPLSRALSRSCADVAALSPVLELPGEGLIWRSPEGTWRLGSARFAGADKNHAEGLAVWLRNPKGRRWRFDFGDRLRSDAAEAVARLRRTGEVEICSGDRESIVAKTAGEVGIGSWLSGARPAEKAARLQSLAKEGKRVLMVGDGLNDAPSLAAAHVSVAPSSGTDLAQVSADLVFQGERLGAVALAIEVAQRASRLMRQNLAISLIYNLAAVPLAITGFVTPLVAAIAMSTSSILVIVNALRINRT